MPVKREHEQHPISHFEAPVKEEHFESKYSEERTPDKTVALTNTGISDLDEQIKSMITKTNISAGPGKGLLATCNVCGKQKPLKQMPQHIEANHITGVSHSCDICGKTSRSRNALRVHKQLYHTNSTNWISGQEMVLDSIGKIVQKRESEKQFEKYKIIIEI